MKTSKMTLLILGLASVTAFAKGPGFVKMGSTEEITKNLSNGKLTVFGKEFDAKKYCNEETIANPDQLEAFTLKNKKYHLAILCAGSLDGETNVVSVFNKKGSAKTKTVKPLKSSSRISDLALEIAIKDLVK